MIPLLSGITDTPKCPFFYQNDSFVVPGRDVSMRANVSIAPWHHLGQIHEAEPYHKQADTYKPTQESLSHKTRKVSLACVFWPIFRKTTLTLWRRLVKYYFTSQSNYFLQVIQVFSIYIFIIK